MASKHKFNVRTQRRTSSRCQGDLALGPRPRVTHEQVNTYSGQTSSYILRDRKATVFTIARPNLLFQKKYCTHLHEAKSAGLLNGVECLLLGTSLTHHPLTKYRHKQARHPRIISPFVVSQSYAPTDIRNCDHLHTDEQNLSLESSLGVIVPCHHSL